MAQSDDANDQTCTPTPALPPGVDVWKAQELMAGLQSPSVMHIDAWDVLECTKIDPEAFASFADRRWAEMKVGEQVAACSASPRDGPQDEILIPAAYNAGITIFARRGTVAAAALLRAGELPLK